MSKFKPITQTDKREELAAQIFAHMIVAGFDAKSDKKYLADEARKAADVFYDEPTEQVQK